MSEWSEVTCSGELEVPSAETWGFGKDEAEASVCGRGCVEAAFHLYRAALSAGSPPVLSFWRGSLCLLWTPTSRKSLMKFFK